MCPHVKCFQFTNNSQECVNSEEITKAYIQIIDAAFAEDPIGPQEVNIEVLQSHQQIQT
jgi:hypothetical protein